MKVLQINTTVNSGSTGRIAEDIGNVLIEYGHESYIAYGRGSQPSSSALIKIGSEKDVLFHGITTAIFDKHGFASISATKKLIAKIEQIKPDVIGLHNLHGYYLNIKVLFEYLSRSKTPVLWTLFDCWGFTGHCTYFDDFNCEKWKTECNNCPKTKRYPTSYFLDNSKSNFIQKKRLFNSLNNMRIVVHSKWLQGLVNQSFLAEIKTHHIPSGIDIKKFGIESSTPEILQNIKARIILGVASIWDKRKGLNDFIRLNELIGEEYQIVLVGLSKKQINNLPHNIISITRTENLKELAEFYTAAQVFVNPTYQDNFPTTNLEALACGTPIITYNTGGSPEAIDENTGRVVDKGNVEGILKAIKELELIPVGKLGLNCRERAENLYNKHDRYFDYINLFEQIKGQH